MACIAQAQLPQTGIRRERGGDLPHHGAYSFTKYSLPSDTCIAEDNGPSVNVV